jgi:uncharacterized protein YodC (DUF2158 family)
MSESQFQVGDIVHLNSGSPDLKVMAVVGDKVSVEWGDEEKAEFPAVCVYLIKN